MAQGSVHTMLVAFASGSDSDTQVNTTGRSHRRRMVVGGTVCMAVALVGVLWRSCGRKDLATPAFTSDSLVSLAANPLFSNDERLCGHSASVCVSDLDSYGSVFFTKDCLYGGVGCSALDWTCCRFCGFEPIKCPKDAQVMAKADAKATCETVWADIQKAKAAIEEAGAAIAKAQAALEQAEVAADKNAIKGAQSLLFRCEMDAEKAHNARIVTQKAAQKCIDDKAAADKAAADKVAADKIVSDKIAADKLAADKIAAVEAKKVADDKLAAYNAAVAKDSTYKTAALRSAATKEQADTIAADIVAQAKAAAKRADQDAADKIAAQQVAAKNAADEQIRADELAVNKIADVIVKTF